MENRIRVLESNNKHLNYLGLHLYNSEISDELLQLRDYVKKHIKFDVDDDPKIIFEVLNWVSNQWEHDGFNDAKDLTSLEILKRAHNGEKFRCVEYGKVASDILSSYGIISRTLGVRTKDFHYGGFGMGHVATEVWSNSLKKWIFIDPQFSVYLMSDNIPLNYYEFYELWCKGKLDSVDIHFDKRVITENVDEQAFINQYKDFICKYFGYIQVTFSSEEFSYKVILKLDGKEEGFTFQGLPLEDVVYTDKLNDVYFNLNESVMTFKYKDPVDFNTAFKEYNIKTNEDFINNMSKISSKPNFIVKCFNNTPRFSHYEYSLDNKEWIVIGGDTFDLNLNEGINTVYLRSVNKQGLKGVISYLKIEYF